MCGGVDGVSKHRIHLLMIVVVGGMMCCGCYAVWCGVMVYLG